MCFCENGEISFILISFSLLFLLPFCKTLSVSVYLKSVFKMLILLPHIGRKAFLFQNVLQCQLRISDPLYLCCFRCRLPENGHFLFMLLYMFPRPPLQNRLVISLRFAWLNKSEIKIKQKCLVLLIFFVSICVFPLPFFTYKAEPDFLSCPLKHQAVKTKS